MTRDQVVSDRLKAIKQVVGLTVTEEEVLRIHLELVYEYGARQGVKDLSNKLLEK